MSIWGSSRRGMQIWSGRRDLNPRLRPWQGRTLPLSYSRSFSHSTALARFGKITAPALHSRSARTLPLSYSRSATDIVPSALLNPELPAVKRAGCAYKTVRTNHCAEFPLLPNPGRLRHPLPDYSWRSAFTGSTRAAQRAGTYMASRATATITSGTRK